VINFLLLISILLLVICSHKPKNEILLNYKLSSLDILYWLGTYKDTLPCRDCVGIEITLRLFSDNSYQLSLDSLGKRKNKFEFNGKYKWYTNENIIELIGLRNIPNKYLIRENSLVQMNINDNLITDLTDDEFIIRKIKENIVNKIEDINWILIEINGKSFSRLDKNGKQIQFKLLSNSKRVNGYGGCNKFWGNYLIKEGNRISFSKIASTLRACPDLHLEMELFRIFEKVDNYIIKDNFLYLNKAKMSPLAKFEAVFD